MKTPPKNVTKEIVTQNIVSLASKRSLLSAP